MTCCRSAAFDSVEKWPPLSAYVLKKSFSRTCRPFLPNSEHDPIGTGSLRPRFNATWTASSFGAHDNFPMKMRTLCPHRRPSRRNEPSGSR